RWLILYLGADDTPFVRTVGRKWLISAVARAFQPGCKADCCLILEGPQGIQKSTALRILAGPELYSEFMGADLGSKEAAMQCDGSWIIELAELASVHSSRSQTAVKAFLSRAEDIYRRPYDRHVSRVPRQCIFAGTTNCDT